jgi:hypothetical protein
VTRVYLISCHHFLIEDTPGSGSPARLCSSRLALIQLHDLEAVHGIITLVRKIIKALLCFCSYKNSQNSTKGVSKQ